MFDIDLLYLISLLYRVTLHYYIKDDKLVYVDDKSVITRTLASQFCTYMAIHDPNSSWLLTRLISLSSSRFLKQGCDVYMSGTQKPDHVAHVKALNVKQDSYYWLRREK